MMNTRRQVGLLLGDKRLGLFQYTPKECAIYYCLRQTDQPAFEIAAVNEEVGKGVFATKEFDRGQFLFEYQGELLTREAGLTREREYPPHLGSYIYFFSFKGEYHCVDATRLECVGKYANDATGPLKNAFPKIIEVEGRPHICLFAGRQVKLGDEIRFDYGVPDLPWRKKTKSKRPCAQQIENDSKQMGKRKKKNAMPSTDEDWEHHSQVENNMVEHGDVLTEDINSEIQKLENGNYSNILVETESTCVTDVLQMETERCGVAGDRTENSPPKDDEYEAPDPRKEFRGKEVQEMEKESERCTVAGDRTEKAPPNHDRYKALDLRKEKTEVPVVDSCEEQQLEIGKEVQVEPDFHSVPSCPVNNVAEDSCDSNHSGVYPYFGSILKPLAEVKPTRVVTEQSAETSESAGIHPDVGHDDSSDTDFGDDTESEYNPDESEIEEEDDEFNDENETRPKSDPHSLNEENSFTSQDKKDETPVKKRVRVPTVPKSKTRIWDKQHCCVFCMELKMKLPRHFEQVHKDELEVAKFLAMPKKSAERSKAIEELRRKGDFAHNTEVLKRSEGTIIPCRRPNSCSKEAARNFIPCENCLGFFLAKDLWRHKKNCVHGREKHPKKEGNRKSKRGTHQSTSAALLPVSEDAKMEMKTQILNTMANDQISMVARTDNLIVQFGTKLFFKTGQEKHQHQYIKQKMRELARFLLAVRKLCKSVWSLSDCINPVMFKHVTEAVKNECGYNSNTGRYQIPSLALKLGHSLKKCAKCLKSTALQLQDKDMRTKAEDFQELLDSDWQCEISSQALATLHTNTFNKPKRLPLTDDIRKLNIFLQENARLFTEALQSSATPSNYQNLSQVTQAQLVLFNRRRGGEIERIPVSQYAQGMNKQPLQEDIAASLSPFEKKLANRLHRLEIRGKRGRKVPVLFTKQLKEQVDLLVQNRAACGIIDQSPFLFSRAGNCKTPFRSCDALSKYAEQCGAEKPSLLQSTNLRFHIGTVSQILNLRENELDILAGFMGHDIRVHRQFYRLPDDTLQLAKVSKILMEMENGCIQKHKGKTLDEIEIAEDETLNDEEIKNSTEHAGVESCNGPEAIRRDELVDSEEEQNTSKHTPKSGKRGKRETSGRRPWKEEEKEAVFRQLSKFIRVRKLPGKQPCEDAISKEPALKSRPWSQIKFFVRNILSSKQFENSTK